MDSPNLTQPSPSRSTLTVDELAIATARLNFAALQRMGRYQEFGSFDALPALERSRFLRIARAAIVLTDPILSRAAQTKTVTEAASAMTDRAHESWIDGDGFNTETLALVMETAEVAASELVLQAEAVLRQYKRDRVAAEARQRAMAKDPAFPDVAVGQ